MVAWFVPILAQAAMSGAQARANTMNGMRDALMQQGADVPAPPIGRQPELRRPGEVAPPASGGGSPGYQGGGGSPPGVASPWLPLLGGLATDPRIQEKLFAGRGPASYDPYTGDWTPGAQGFGGPRK